MSSCARILHLRVLLLAGLIATTSLLAVSAGPGLQSSNSTPQAAASSGFVVVDAPGAGAGTMQGTAATAIDAAGDVAGVYLDAAGVEHAFVRSAGGTITTFDAPGSGTKSNSSVTVPVGFDSAGNLAGISSDLNGLVHGLVRAATTGKLTQFDVPGAGTSGPQGTFPSCINAAGTIAGVYIDANNVAHGFVRTVDTKIATFDAFVLSGQQGKDNEGTYVDSIDAAGDVAGAYVDANSVVHGFVRTALGKVTTIDAPKAGKVVNTGTAVTAMDAGGDVTGAYLDASGAVHGFVLPAKGILAGFDVPGASAGAYMGTYPTGIDAAGEVSGMYADANMVVHGFFRSAAGAFATFDAPGANLSANAFRKGFAGRQNKAGRGGSPSIKMNSAGLLGRAFGLLDKAGKARGGLAIFGNKAAAGANGSNLTNGSGGLVYGTGNFGNLGLNAINASGAITGIYADGAAVGHGYLRAANGNITGFDAPGAGAAVFQGTGGLSINASGTIAGAYADANSVLHGFVLTLGQTATTTTLASSQASSVFGEAVTLTAKVAAGTSVPPNGETVWFMNGTGVLGTETLTNGAATLTTTLLPGGANSLTAVYGGDVKLAGSKSAALTETIGKANSSTKLAAKPNPTTFGQFTTLTATVTGQFGGTATGTVTFKNGTATVGTASLSGGQAGLTTAALPAGTDSITAQYGGSASFTASTSTAVSQVVTKATPTVAWATPASIPAGMPLGAAQLDAIASVAGTFAYTPGPGTVLKAGTTWLSAKFTPADTTDYNTAQASVTLLVTAAATATPTVKVTPALTSITTAQVLPVKVTVAGQAGKATPTGSVVLTSGSYSSPAQPLAIGTTTIEIPAGSLAVAQDTLTASFTPDSASWSTYTAAKGTSAAVTVTQVVIKPWSTTTTLAVSSGGVAATTVKPGSAVTLTATVKDGSTVLTSGLVNFCDASAAFCTDIHLLGSAQLTKAGTAAIKLRPGIGSHSYRAAFAGTKNYSPSFSATSALKVAGATGAGLPANVAIAQSGPVGNYTLTATVSGAGTAAPTGTVSFQDSTYGNAVLGTAALQAGAPGLNWVGAPQTTAGFYSSSVATADFNGDGILDVAVTGYGNGVDGQVTVLLGNGDGTFTAKPSLVTGVDPQSIAVGDFNRDGIPDLAVLNYANGNGNGSLTILLGNGDGTFIPSASGAVTVGNGPVSVAVGDFNGDGVADLAVANQGGGTLSILLGDGKGAFTQAANSPVTVGSQPHSVAVGDFNGDGFADLAVANEGSNSVTILLGKGDGTFNPTPSGPIAAGYYPYAIAVADFNGDGNLDLAVTNVYSSGVLILLGNGKGTFTLANNMATVYNPNAIAVGDFNGDGIPDLAVTNENTYGSTTKIHLGNGDGTFTAAANNPPTGSYPQSIAVGDFNGDGIPDLVVANQYGYTATTLLTVPQMASATITGIAVAGLGPHQAVVSYPGDSGYSAGVSGTTPLYAPTPAPVFSLASGSYTAVQTLTIADAIKGSNIYYTTDGSTPGTWSTQYMGPIQVAQSETVKAIAQGSGYAQGPGTSATYTINLAPAATPAISPAAGVYATTQLVTITDATPEAAIYYTTNGSTPTTASARYAGPITVSTSETIVAIATGAGHATSLPATAQYLIKSSAAPLIYTVAGNANQGYSGDGGPGVRASVNLPYGTGLDSAGDLYIADTGNNRIRRVDAKTGVIATVAGNGSAGYSGDNGPATGAQLNGPQAVAVDSAGNLYIADTNNSAIRKVAKSSGLISTLIGSDNLYNPEGVALDLAGNLYIADSYDSVVQRVDAKTQAMTIYAGQLYQYSYGGDGGPATSAQLQIPTGVAVDGAGNLYIADSNNTVIRKVTAGTHIISTVAGTVNGPDQGNGGYTGDGGPATNAELNFPESVAVDGSGNLYIADTFNYVIRRVAASTGIITTIAGNGPPACVYSGDGGPAASAGLCYPYGVSSDSAGNLYIADTDDLQIRKVTAAAAPPIAAAASPWFSVSAGSYSGPKSVTISDTTPGASIYYTMDGTAPNASSPQSNGPINVSGTVTIKATAIAPGYLQSPVVTAAYTITSAPTAVITTVVGNGVYGFSGAGGPATSAELGSPFGTAFDSAGNFYVSDVANNVVWKVTAKTGLISIVAGNGTQGYSGDNGPATSAQLYWPRKIALDGGGNLYIVDRGNQVIRKVAAGTGVITTFAGIGRSSGYSGDNGPANAAHLHSPDDAIIDKANNLLIADSSNCVVRKVNLSSAIITTAFGNKSNCGHSGDGGPATSAGIPSPVVLAFDGAGNLYIVESFSRIRRIDATTGIITTVAGNGDMGYSGDGGPAVNAEIDVWGMAVDAAGTLFLSNFPGAVRMVAPGTGVITTIAGTGFCSYSGDGGSATVAGMCAPYGISFDTAGSLYIADMVTSRVRKVSATTPAATPTFLPKPGTFTSAQTVTISSTPGATIYYTTDLSTPTASSKLYTSAGIKVAATATIKAIAFATGYAPSAVGSGAYTISTTPSVTSTAETGKAPF